MNKLNICVLNLLVKAIIILPINKYIIFRGILGLKLYTLNHYKTNGRFCK
jgi:hypothetical protein